MMHFRFGIGLHQAQRLLVALVGALVAVAHVDELERVVLRIALHHLARDNPGVLGGRVGFAADDRHLAGSD